MIRRLRLKFLNQFDRYARLFCRGLVVLRRGVLSGCQSRTRYRLPGALQVFQTLVELLFVRVTTAAGAADEECSQDRKYVKAVSSQHTFGPEKDRPR